MKGLIAMKIKHNKGNLSSRILLAVFMMALTVTVLIFPFTSFACSPQPPAARENLVLGVYAGDFSSLIWVAENRGYFRDEGLDVTIKEFDTGVTAAQAMLHGEVEIATGADFVAVNNIFSDSSIRIISAIASVESNDVIARQDHGIQSPVDLRNKKIAVPKGSIAEFYLGKFLLINKLTLSDVQIVYLQPAPLSEALMQGEVDAAVIWDPFAYDLKAALGQNGVVWTPTAGKNWDFLLLTGDATVNTRPGALEKLLRALLKAEDFIKKNPDRAQTIVAERLKLQMSYIQYAWSRRTYTLSLPQVLLLMMEDEARWMIQNKLTDKTAVPNYLNNIYMGGLLKVNPEAVSIIR
jgi:NitT/TauT family transport system substrate-binding protein